MRKNYLKAAKFAVAPYLVTPLVWLLTKSCQQLPVKGVEHIKPFLTDKTPFLPCYWHQQSVFCIHYLIQLQQQGLKLGFLSSPSRDGEIAAKIFELCGARAIRGSSSKTGAQALRDIYLAIVKEKLTIGTAPDGPRGPAFQFKQGWITLAQLSGAPIVPIAYCANRSWQLKTWDHFFIPKPFANIAIAVGEPLYVAKKLDKDDIAALQEEMTLRLNNLTLAAKLLLV